MFGDTPEIIVASRHLAQAYEQAALWMVSTSSTWLKDHDNYAGLELSTWITRGGGAQVCAEGSICDDSLEMLDISACPTLSFRENLDMCARIYDTICKGFLGAAMKSCLRLCDLPQCEERLNGRISACVPFRKKWVCCACQFTIEQEENLKSRQRSMVTPKLRLEILKRDEFACRFCRRTSTEDKVKLAVDHIVPVALGGKTVKDNLQTLCFECNSGKSDSLL